LTMLARGMQSERAAYDGRKRAGANLIQRV
jgi:hypothetical protein